MEHPLLVPFGFGETSIDVVLSVIFTLSKVAIFTLSKQPEQFRRQNLVAENGQNFCWSSSWCWCLQKSGDKE
jgi:hypothetical protein